MKRFLTMLPLLAVLGFAMPRWAAAIVLNVNTEEDTNDGSCDDGTCSVRDAILVSNATLPEGDPFNTILIPAGHYVITQPDINENAGLSGDFDIIDNDVLIRGTAGAELTIIDGEGLDRIFDVPDPLNVTFEGLTLTRGDTGGINNENGGAIRYSGAEGFLLEVKACEFTSNNAFSGGAIRIASNGDTEGKLVLRDSTLAGNTTTSEGGALSARDSHVDIVNTTFSGNSAALSRGAIVFRTNNAMIAATLQLSSVTIFDNHALAESAGGLGIENLNGSASLAIANTILFGNTAAMGSPNCQLTGAVDELSAGFNIFGDLTGCDITPTLDNTTDDPQLQPLADNGGPTRTHAFSVDSAAFDGGNPLGCVDFSTQADLTLDQRFQDRPLEGCDVGAFELGASDLQISKRAGIDAIEVGGDVTYTIEVRNEGPGKNFNVTVTDTLPAGLAFESATPAENCSHDNGVVTCQFDDLAAGENQIITLVATATQVGVISNSVSVAGTEVELNPDDNESSDDVTVTAAPVPGAVCGNGDLEAGEACDDGNLVNGDECSSLCTIEDDGNGDVIGGGGCSLGAAASSPALGAVLLALVSAFAVKRRSQS